jgi:hypothetical protein
MSVEFKYGDYNFDPKPSFSINIDNLKTPDGTGYGKTYTISIEGSLLLKPSEAVSGVVGTFQKIEDLKDALDREGKLFLISCNDLPIISGYPAISESLSIDRKEDSYARRADYKFSFEMQSLIGPSGDNFNNSAMPPFVESCSESWSVNFEDERTPFDWKLIDGPTEKFGYKILVSHDVDVKGRLVYTGSTSPVSPWVYAKDYAESKLGFDNEMVNLEGIFAINSSYFSTFDVFNQYRNFQVDKTNGNVKATETFIVTPSGSNSLPNNSVETFNINMSESDSLTTVSVDGEIQGLAKIHYPSGIFVQQSSKMAAASGYFNVIEPRLYQRAVTTYENIHKNSRLGCNSIKRPLNSNVVSKTIGVNPIEGTISYSYTFNTERFCINHPCIISQNISISDTYPNNVFAEQVVLGRSLGPILQDIGTVTNRVRNVSIEMVVVPPTGCDRNSINEVLPRSAINSFISGVRNDLEESYPQVFVSQNTEDFNITQGRFVKNIGFTYGKCNI